MHALHAVLQVHHQLILAVVHGRGPGLHARMLQALCARGVQGLDLELACGLHRHSRACRAPPSGFEPIDQDALPGLSKHRGAVRLLTCRHREREIKGLALDDRFSALPGICAEQRCPPATFLALGKSKRPVQRLSAERHVEVWA